jgi:hypothetical protein
MKKSKSKKKIILIASVIISLALLTWVVILVIRRKKKNEPLTQSVVSAVSSAITVGYTPESFPLKKGMQGNNVMIMQWSLMDLGYNVGSAGADGKFGKSTLTAVLDYFENKKDYVTQGDWQVFYDIYADPLKGNVHI